MAPTFRQHKSKGRFSGFTLIELLLVATLLAMVATIVVPKFSKVFRVSLQSSVRRFAALIRYTHNQALITGRLHRIVLNLDQNSWKVEVAQPGALPLDRARLDDKRDDDTGPSEPAFKPINDTNITAVPSGVEIVEVKSPRLGKGKTVTKGEVAVYAYPSGFIDPATIVLAETGKSKIQKYVLTLENLTGRVLVEVENARP